MSAPLTVYTSKSYTGTNVGLQYGYYPSVGSMTGIANNSIASLVVAAWTTVILYQSINYGGTGFTITGPVSVPDLSHYGNGKMYKKISSIKVVSVPPSSSDANACCFGQTASASCGTYQPGSALCQKTLAKTCASKMNTAACQAWARKNTSAADTIAIAYCQTNPKDPFCACISSPAATSSNPRCVDKNCLENGYVTTNMANSACPSVVTCNVQNVLSNSGISLVTNIPVEQNCGTTGTTSATTTTSTSGLGAITATDIFIVIVIMLLIVAAVWYVMSMSADASDITGAHDRASHISVA